jgi:serine protease inhibitor
MKRTLIGATIIILVFFSGIYAQQSQTRSLQAFVEDNNRFGFKYIRQLQQKDPNKNHLIAPASLSMAFALLQNGASKTSSDEIAGTFERQALSLDQLNSAAKELIMQLTPPKDSDPNWVSTLGISNSLWIAPPETFSSTIVSLASDSYAALAHSLSGKPAADQQTIDAFLSKSLSRQFNIPMPELRRKEFALITATLFNGKWASEFDEDKTVSKDFKFRDHTKRPVDMMDKESRFLYLKGKDFQAVCLSYTGRYRMYVFLPDQDEGIDALISDLDNTNWVEWTSSFEKGRAGTLELPKFRIDLMRNSTTDFMQLGIREPFSRFTSMANLITNPAGAKLTRVLEDASIDVSEKRTVVITRMIAGGIPGGIVGRLPGSPPPPPPFHMLVDHPFLFAIVDEPTKSILYIGVVADPPLASRKKNS